MKTGTTEKEVEVEKEVHIVNLFVIHLVFMGIYKILPNTAGIPTSKFQVPSHKSTSQHSPHTTVRAITPVPMFYYKFLESSSSWWADTTAARQPSN